jgi:serine/threonine protein kinase
MHNNDLYHRDIRPDNILLDDVGHVVLIDFGFGCKASDVSRCAFVHGFRLLLTSAPPRVREVWRQT